MHPDSSRVGPCTSNMAWRTCSRIPGRACSLANTKISIEGTSVAAVVPELQLHAEVVLFQDGDRALEVVLVGARDANGLGVDRRLHALQLGVLQVADDLFGLLRGEPVLDRHHLAARGAGGGLDLAGLEVLERHLAL